MGFVPVAFRAGSTGKRRVHIFWQRRINANDVTTAYWYPCQTNNGAIREDRLVFPIPPAAHWGEVEAVELPTTSKPALEAPQPQPKSQPRTRKTPKPTAPKGPLPTTAFGLRFGPPPALPEEPQAKRERPVKEKVKACPERSRRIDPQLVSKARELRDRYLEQVNERSLIAPRGKYDVARALPSTGGAMDNEPLRVLPEPSAPIAA